VKFGTELGLIHSVNKGKNFKIWGTLGRGMIFNMQIISPQKGMILPTKT